MQDHTHRKAGFFIDLQNLFGQVKSLGVGRFNYQIIREYLEQRYDLIKCVAFTCEDPEQEAQRGFIVAIASLGFRVVTKPIKPMLDGKIKANCDMEMALETLQTAKHLDVVILGTGDDDFASVATQLSLMGKTVLALSSDHGMSLDLLKACDARIRIEDIKGAIEYDAETIQRRQEGAARRATNDTIAESKKV